MLMISESGAWFGNVRADAPLLQGIGHNPRCGFRIARCGQIARQIQHGTGVNVRILQRHDLAQDRRELGPGRHEVAFSSTRLRAMTLRASAR